METVSKHDGTLYIETTIVAIKTCEIVNLKNFLI